MPRRLLIMFKLVAALPQVPNDGNIAFESFGDFLILQALFYQLKHIQPQIDQLLIVFVRAFALDDAARGRVVARWANN